MSQARRRPGSGPPTHCVDHVDRTCMDNIYATRCESCSTTASFGIPGERSTHCAVHADRSIMEPSGRKCASCGAKPTFGIPGGPPTHCFTHADHDIMEDVVNRRCYKCSLRAGFYDTSGKLPHSCAEHRSSNHLPVGRTWCVVPGCTGTYFQT